MKKGLWLIVYGKITFTDSPHLRVKLFYFFETRFIAKRADKYEAIARTVVNFSESGKLVLAGRVQNRQFVRDTINVMPLDIIILDSFNIEVDRLWRYL